jgi:hypothetical protein
MSLRNGGYADQSTLYALFKEDGLRVELGGWEGIVVDEYVDAYMSLVVKNQTGVTSVLDPVGDWLVQKVIAKSLGENFGLQTFETVVLSDVPNFYDLPWDAPAKMYRIFSTVPDGSLRA